MEVIDCLPEDILLEIFSRLRKKSQRRCEAVSKNWQNLIVKTQNLIGKTAPFRDVYCGFVDIIICYDVRWEDIRFYDLDDKGRLFHVQDSAIPSHLRIRNTGSCNGFIFFYSEDPNSDSTNGNLHLYNPFTGHLTTLPPFPLPILNVEVSSIPYGLGFVPDPETNHFKFLVFYAPIEYGLGLQIATFNSETREWKAKPARTRGLQLWEELGVPPCAELGAMDFYFRGSLYWFLVPESLYCYSMKTEDFHSLELPEFAKRTMYHGALWESEGSIHYCQHEEIHGLGIWVLDENPAESSASYLWRKIYSIPNESIARAPNTDGLPEFIMSRRVCGFNEHLHKVLLLSFEGLFWYDISEKTMSVSLSWETVPYETFQGLTPPISFTYNDMELPDLGEPADQPEY